ncbi:MAG: hypothetical protein HRT37_09525 [Alteromonadaceae bacterium]|nr:hypothetical protein [Alteromonadaceae bacterium]
MKYLISILFTIISLHSISLNAKQGRKVLIFASNIIDMGDPEKYDVRNNLWKVAPPYHVFVSHGYNIDFVSPNDGQVLLFTEVVGISSYTIH